MGLRKDILKAEFTVYITVWCTAVLYAVYCFARSSDKYFQHYEDLYADFDQGWSFIDRKKDAGDYEWISMKQVLKTLSWWLIFSTISSEIIRHFHLLQILPFWQVLIAVSFVLTEFGVGSLGIILFQPFLFVLVLSITRNKSIIWLINAVVILLIFNFRSWCRSRECFDFLKLNIFTASATKHAISWMNLRYLSCSMYVIDSKKRQTDIKYVAYLLYLPNLVCGPFISFEQFQGCFQPRGQLKQRTFELIKDVFRFLFWLAFVEFSLHFVYVNAIQHHYEEISSFDLISLYGYGYTMGQFFHLKYLVYYGLATTFPKFENVQVPTIPVCIGRIHLYSDMWKYFDAGLYNFLLRDIYIPLMKNRFVKNRLLASFICFVFVYIWHGLEYVILLWSTLNYLGIVLEYFTKWIHENFLQKVEVYGRIDPKWLRRITCMGATPLLIMSAISNFYFFAGIYVGDIFVSRFLNSGPKAIALLMAITYTCCQVSTEIKYQLHSKPRKLKST